MALFLVSLIPYIIFTLFKVKKAIHMLQQNYYDESERYFLWILKNPKKVWLELDVFFPILIALLFTRGKIQAILFGIFYTLLAAEYHARRNKEQVKKPLVVTARVKRLMITIFLLYLVMILPMILCFYRPFVGYYYLYLGLVAYLVYMLSINRLKNVFFFTTKRKQLKK